MTKYLVVFLLCFMTIHKAMVVDLSLIKHRYPKMVIFGFDKTLWPITLGTDVVPPFQKRNISDIYSDILDANGVVVPSYPEVNKVLKYLKTNKIRMAVASNTRESDGARQLCTMFGWNKYFISKMVYPSVTKDEQVIRISQRCKVALSDMLFFDDKQNNVLALERVGVVANIVKNGMTIKDLMHGIFSYSDKYSSPLAPKLYRKPVSKNLIF